ncbi:cysteine proteinase [Ascodesmis nigricans]|uniref:Cysteine proteinase n=1 Tax=Ascodesmis nigricans TaxID=341454 RepID=A0A4S2MTQ1_9PEZI|nr:cysteine proteinase [Ascodesmis nigricans]
MAELCADQPSSAQAHSGPSLVRLAAASEARADSFFSSGNRPAALEAAIKAVELYLKARSHTSSPQEKQKLDKKCNELFVKAERWKKSAALCESPALNPTPPAAPRPSPKPTNQLSTREKTILWKSSKVKGNVFPPWTAAPLPAEFAGDHTFLDDCGLLELSDAQKDALDSWKRPHEKFGDNANIISNDKQLDLTQDIVTDCSVVASLCSAVRREEMGFGKTVSNILYPHDEKGDNIPSPSGKYVVKLFINGCWRKVIIDDLLPVSKSTRSLYVTCRNNPSVYGHALIEKAYLKVMGGYDFPGSNSGTDLLALTGWIPEHVFLQSEDLIQSTLWRRMVTSWNTGDVLITLGTGRLTQREENELGLIGEHDYAVLDLKEENGEKKLLVKNPWTEGTVWTGIAQEYDSDEDFDAPRKEEPPPSALQPGTFWMSLDNVCRNFFSVYLNWNPGLFTHVYETHFDWDLSTKISETSFRRNPQFLIRNNSRISAPIWILLSRHIGVPAIPPSQTPAQQYIALYVFDASGHRVYLSSPYLHRTNYVDSPQTLLRLDDIPPSTTYTLVVASQGLPPEIHHFSLHVYSLQPLHISPAIDLHPYQLTLTSSWTRLSAGGPAHSSHYPTNPQFLLTAPSGTANLHLILESATPHPIHIQLVHPPTSSPSSHPREARIATITVRDMISSSGDYTRGTAMARIPPLPPGRYTAIASTFEPNQTGHFHLTALSTSADVSLIQLPDETAGMFLTDRQGSWEGRDKIVLPMEVARIMKVWVKARLLKRKMPVRLTVREREGGRVVAASGEGEFRDLPMGVRTREVDFWPGGGGYEVVLERAGRGEGEWEVVVVSEEKVWVGEGEEEDEAGEDSDDDDDDDYGV